MAHTQANLLQASAEFIKYRILSLGGGTIHPLYDCLIRDNDNLYYTHCDRLKQEYQRKVGDFTRVFLKLVVSGRT